jgi:hypothetical protein
VAEAVRVAKLAVDGLTCTRYMAPERKARLPLTIIVLPGVPSPGANVAPELTVVLDTIPVPSSVPPELPAGS